MKYFLKDKPLLPNLFIATGIFKIMTIINLENISAFYNKLKALDNLSFSVEESEIFGLLGPNGSGKTTTLKILTGLIKPVAGRALIKNLDTWNDRNKLKGYIGYCPQFNSFNEKLTVRENIKYFAELYEIKDNLDDLAENVCAYLSLTKRIDTLAEILSGGFKRRLNIACGILNEPQVLFLDEPSIGLDPISRNELWKLIKEISSEGTTVIIATNIMEEAEYLCNKVALLKNGRNIVTGTIDEIRRKTPRIETILIYTKSSLENFQKIENYVRSLEGVLDVEYSNEIIRIKTRPKYTDDVIRYVVSHLRMSFISVEDVNVIPSSLIDAFEILVGAE